jgi:hypothetical protein
MLNADDEGTFRALRELTRLVRESKKPPIFWVGAGASKWLGYPLWAEIAADLQREFFRHVGGFDNGSALKLIAAGSFPDFFQLCRDLDRARYLGFLGSCFLPRPDTPLYKRFTERLDLIQPFRILTTNVDEALEQRFPVAGVFQRSDITGCISHLQSGKSFIAKLHGSRSAVESMVFTSEDYEQVRADSGYISTLKAIFAMGSVIFLGYGVTDEYVLNLLSDNARDFSLFGAGPHFVVSSSFKEIGTLRRINYSLKRFSDHRSAITVLDVIQQVEARKAELAARPEVTIAAPAQGRPPDTRTSYFLSDFNPPGTWTNFQTVQFEGAGRKAEMTIGLGFTNHEVPFSESTAAHDLAIGLICFDSVCLPLSALYKVVALLGDSMWPLVEGDSVRFIHMQHEPAIINVEGDLLGDIGLVTLNDPGGGPQTPGVAIRRQIKPAVGKEARADELISTLETKTLLFAEGDRLELASLVRAALMMPDVSRLLGIGEAILPSQIPMWLKFSCLRMAHLVHTGALCDHFGIQAAKVPFGGAVLASAAFGVQSASESADQYASYVLAGRFDTDVGIAILAQPAILRNILLFRATAEGQAFRREVRGQLLENAASEFSASINAGLKRNIPLDVLQKARDRLSSLVTESIKASPVPAVWTNTLQSDNSTHLWRSRSRATLLELAGQRGIRGDDPCLCGSGDKLRLCCLLPLRD